jgi:release factor glutamine methyltransferase
MSKDIKNLEIEMPRAYVEGSVLFHDLNIKVSKDCLIPRMETEILVERALKRLPLSGDVLDLCTGSGAIGLSIKKLRPGLKVTLADISTKALLLAKQNAIENAIDVEIVEGDFLEPFKGRLFDAIICNPPYVSQSEYNDLDPLVKNFEPHLALVGGKDGLKFYKKLAKEALSVLKDGGVLCLEIGKDQANDLLDIFSDKDWKNIIVEKDYSSHDRFFFLENATKKE